jgi:predicted O-methyltransferase YrrM
MDLKEAEEMDKVFRSMKLEGWIEPTDIMKIFNYVADLQPGQIYLEIGVAYGKSACVACLAAQEGVTLYGIDCIDQDGRERNMVRFLSQYNKAMPDWHFIEEDSQTEAMYWDHRMVDLLFIDGDHSYEGALKDIASWTPWVNHKGIILFDDYDQITGVKQAINDTLLHSQFYHDQIVDHNMFSCIKN